MFRRLNRFLNMKALVGTFKQEKALAEAFLVIVKLNQRFVESSSGDRK